MSELVKVQHIILIVLYELAIIVSTGRHLHYI